MSGVDAATFVSIQCSVCHGQIRLGDQLCPACGRTLTEDELDALRRRWEGSDPEAARLGNAVAYGRATLLAVAGLSFIEALIYGVIGESLPTLAFGGVISASMIALFFWGRRRPLPAMVVGVAVFLGLQVLATIVSVAALAQGFLLKIFVLGAFAGGIGAELNRRRQEKMSLRRRRGG
jgi:hypothetical protein